MLRLTAVVTGRTEGDIEALLNEVMRSVENGIPCGQDSNDAGDYVFEVLSKDERSAAGAYAAQLSSLLVSAWQDGLSLDELSDAGFREALREIRSGRHDSLPRV